jgi:hypothetical protein
MRKNKPGFGFNNMLKVTTSEAKLLGLDRKMMIKIIIMTDESGKVSFWLRKAKSDEVTKFTGSDDEYFDDNLASIKLEQYWSKYSLS